MPKQPGSSFLKPWCGCRNRQVTVKPEASNSHHRGDKIPLRPTVPFSSNCHLWLRPVTWKTRPLSSTAWGQMTNKLAFGLVSQETCVELHFQPLTLGFANLLRTCAVRADSLIEGRTQGLGMDPRPQSRAALFSVDLHSQAVRLGPAGSGAALGPWQPHRRAGLEPGVWSTPLLLPLARLCGLDRASPPWVLPPSEGVAAESHLRCLE